MKTQSTLSQGGIQFWIKWSVLPLLKAFDFGRKKFRQTNDGITFRNRLFPLETKNPANKSPLM